MTRILLLEDDPNLGAVLEEHLEMNGFAVRRCVNGEEGESAFRAAPYDLCLVDVMMPRKDGYVLCAELKANPATRDIPIILLTAVGEAVPSTRYSHADGMATEADDYIPKPVDTEDLWQAVKNLL